MNEPSAALDARVPPAVVALVVGGVMRLAVAAAPGLTRPGRFALVAGGTLALAGALVATAGLVAFAASGTTANPMRPERASALVASGVYGRTRNPMYVGMTLALVGLGVLWAHPLAIALSAVFPAYIDRFQIPPEERAMERLFGHAFRSYAARVPRWL